MEKENGRAKIVIFIVIFLIIALSAGAAYYYVKYIKEGDIQFLGTEVVKEEEEIKTVQIFKGEDRPIAVMIDNHKDAMPHAGLSKAYVVYEAIVEGGESRLMALFKGVDVENIGPVRSSRHYFLDYALENDAIYVHYGWSPQAEKDISSLKVNNINGLVETEKEFWRAKGKAAPHNVVTSTEQILKLANSKKYRTTSTEGSVLNYTTDEVDFGEVTENTQANETSETDTTVKVLSANKVKIPYSQSNLVTWEYNEEAKNYIRYSKGIKETEWYTGEDVTAKNIIVEFVKNSVLNDGENKDRQDLNTTGLKRGYYITNGKAIEILCSKNSRTDKTIYKDRYGNQIKVNDGNTFIQICPADASVEME